MTHQRPINLDLGSLRYPPMAIVSILHRISGILLFILLPFILYLLSLSLQSTSSYDELRTLLTLSPVKLCLWVFSSAMIYHVIAGVRHIILDMGIGEDVQTARLSAFVVIFLAVVMTFCLGIWIW